MKTERSAYAEILPRIVDLRAQGKTIPEIAETLCYSKRQINKYIAYAKANGIPVAKASPWRDDWYLGRLCPRGHDHQGTGKSLRTADSKCAECVKEYYRVFNRKRYPRKGEHGNLTT